MYNVEKSIYFWGNVCFTSFVSESSCIIFHLRRSWDTSKGCKPQAKAHDRLCHIRASQHWVWGTKPFFPFNPLPEESM